jgi:hypothetical protein
LNAQKLLAESSVPPREFVSDWSSSNTCATGNELNLKLGLEGDTFIKNIYVKRRDAGLEKLNLKSASCTLCTNNRFPNKIVAANGVADVKWPGTCTVSKSKASFNRLHELEWEKNYL